MPIERRMAEIQLAGVAENEVEADRQQHVDRADDQIRAPIGVVEDERQNDDDRDREQISQPPGPQRRALTRQMLRRAPDQTFSSRLSDDEPGRPDGQHQQEKRENDDVDQARIEKLRRVAFDQADDKPGDESSLRHCRSRR